MTTIALVGESGAIDKTRRRLTDSPLPFDLVADEALADLVVTDEVAPTPNHLGVAAATAPDRFFCTDESVDYVVDALTEAHLAGAHGVRVRRSVQDRPDAPVLGLQSKLRSMIKRISSRGLRFNPVDYDWATDETVEVDVFDDEVIVTVGEEILTARLRARGHVDGNDGHFHWVGILYSDRAAELKDDGKSTARVRTADGEDVPARLAEITRWGTVRMTGVGTPPWM